MKEQVNAYFQQLSNALESVGCTDQMGARLSRNEAYERAVAMSMQCTARGNKILFVGNGGSAGIASHMAIDFSKNGGMPAMCFNDGAALTCLGNDYGYEEVFSRQIGFHARPGDLLVAISSSGNSKNILNAVDAARQVGCAVITMSGFREENPLRAKGDLNFHVGLCDYGIVEVAHTALIHAVVDLKRTCFAMAQAAGQAES